MTSQSHPAVIVGVDGSDESLVAMELAAGEAIRRHQPLRMITAVLWPLFAPAMLVPEAGMADETRAAGLRLLDEHAARLRERHPSLDVTTEAVMGGPSGVLLDESEQASLAVVGNRGRGGFASLLAGSVATQLATHARCPVIVARPGTDPDAATVDPVVVGVDGKERTEPAIEFAFETAASRGVSLTAVHVWAEPPVSGIDPFKPVAFDYDEARKAAARVLAESLAGFSDKYPDVPVFRQLVCGVGPAYHLLRACREASLVVVGSRGRGELSGVVLGSVGQNLVHHAKCAVAVVRAETP